jgi:hypothetical protein
MKPDCNPDSLLNKSDWFYELDSGSQVWIGGLDDKERTEKILGNEYSTIYFNECSQIPYSSIITARTRLAEKNALANKFYYDENPPTRSHWTYKEFIKHESPVDHANLDADNFVAMRLNPEGNKDNIDEEYLEELEHLPPEQRRRFLLGEFGDAVTGAVYGHEMAKVYEEGRVARVPYNPAYEVHTWWDIGQRDSTSIWFVQYVGMEIHVIDFYQNNGKGADFYAKIIKEKDYNYARHNLPHDAGNAQFGLGGKSISDLFKKMGLSNKVHPRTPSIQNDIYATRLIFSRCWFDEDKCRDGLEALEAYHYEHSEKMGTDKSTPEHDWSSHAADAFRYLAIGYREKMGMVVRPRETDEMTFADVFHFIQEDSKSDGDIRV